MSDYPKRIHEVITSVWNNLPEELEDEFLGMLDLIAEGIRRHPNDTREILTDFTSE